MVAKLAKPYRLHSMILTHLVLFNFLRGASVYVPPAGVGFKGYTTVGPLTYMRAFSPVVVPPVDTGQSMYPIQRRRRGR